MNKKVSIEADNRLIGEVLNEIFENSDVSYTVVDKVIVITPKKEQQNFKVTGTVTASTGETLPGVTILVKGTETGTITGMDGKYSIEVPDASSVLVFSYVGYTTQEVNINGRSVVDIILVESIEALEEVVVIGYGTMKKSDLTGSVTSVSSKDFVRGVTTNALQLLRGKAPGVNISQSNSEPGGALTIRVRGAGSINSSNNVLVVVDGLPGADPSSLNPNDIESIEVLKDASAAAIYGTRAANGVVLITTKKGNKKVPIISYNTYLGFQTPASKIDVLDATQYMNYLNDISRDLGRSLPFTDAEIAAAGKGTDWQEELFRNAWVSNHQLAINGGSEYSNYYVSLGYLDQDGILISSGLKKYNALVNFEINPSNKFKFGLNMNGVMNFKDIIANTSDSGNENADPLNAAIQFDPTLTPEKDANGEYQRNPSIALDNPIAMAYGYDDKERNNSVYGSTYGQYEIIDGLKVTVRLGTHINNGRFGSYKDRTTERGKANGGIGNISSWTNNYLLAEGLINYEKTFGQHYLSFMGGSTWEKFENLSQYSYATGFLSDVTNTNLLSSGTKETFNVNSSKNTHALQSFFARFNYTLQNKYLLTTTIRRDGSSRFSEKNKFAIFPSIALGWKITEENFMKNIPAISQLKLRFGYGQMGNEGISNFETIQTFVAGGNTVLGGSILGGAQPARIPNTDLKWETTEEYNYGLDFGFFDNRISGNIEYYVKNTIDQLFNKPVPMSTGFSSMRTNFGKVRNTGIDLNITTHNLAGQFKWTTNLTFSTLHNKVVELPPYAGEIITGRIIANIPAFSLVKVDYTMNAFYGYKVTGIFQENDDIADSPQPSAHPGEPIFLDNDKNGKIDANDRVVLGDPFPDFTFSLNNSFSYKNFNLEVYFIGVQGIETFNGNIVESIFPINFQRNILVEHYLERWTPANPNAKYPSGANSSIYFGGGKMINSCSIQDASFLRLKNVTLSYNISLNNFKVFKSALVYLSADNLFTLTKFDGFDPDANQSGTNVAKSSFNNYPIARVFRIGANIDF